MGFTSVLEKSLTKFGENTNPTIVAIGVATAKGIFRPTFTMMDKKEDFETKRYAALREGLTELIAIPTYFLSGVTSKAVAQKLAKPKYFMKKDIFEKYNAGDTSTEILSAVKNAELLAKENLPKIRTCTSFIGVCLSALIIIPLLCSITIKPILKKIKKNDMAKKQNSIQPLTKNISVNKSQTFKRISPTKLNNYGSCIYNPAMKVGSV